MPTICVVLAAILRDFLERGGEGPKMSSLSTQGWHFHLFQKLLKKHEKMIDFHEEGDMSAILTHGWHFQAPPPPLISWNENPPLISTLEPWGRFLDVPKKSPEKGAGTSWVNRFDFFGGPKGDPQKIEVFQKNGKKLPPKNHQTNDAKHGFQNNVKIECPKSEKKHQKVPPKGVPEKKHEKWKEQRSNTTLFLTMAIHKKKNDSRSGHSTIYSVSTFRIKTKRKWRNTTSNMSWKWMPKD